MNEGLYILGLVLTALFSFALGLLVGSRSAEL